MITRHRLLFLLGLWIVLIPFLGFPTNYKSFFVIVSGLFVALIAFTSARAKRAVTRRPRTASSRRERATSADASTTASTLSSEPEVLTEVIPDKDITELDAPRS